MSYSNDKHQHNLNRSENERRCTWEEAINEVRRGTSGIQRSVFLLLRCCTASQTYSVPSKKISHRANVCFSAHAIAQLCRHTTSEAVKGLCDLYAILILECYKCARMRFHCANRLVVLRICAPWGNTANVSTNFLC